MLLEDIDEAFAEYAKQYPASVIRETKRDIVAANLNLLDPVFALMLIGYCIATYKDEPDLDDLRHKMIDIAGDIYKKI